MFLLALVAYILWWLRSNLLELGSATRFFKIRFSCELLCYHVYLTLWSYFGGKKNGGCAGLFWTVFKGVAFSPETRFLKVLFYFLICVFFLPVPNFDPPFTLCAVLDIDSENAFTALIFVFLLLLQAMLSAAYLRNNAACFFRQEVFHEWFVLNADSFCFNLFRSIQRLASPLWRMTCWADFFFQFFISTCILGFV